MYLSNIDFVGSVVDMKLFIHDVPPVFDSH